MYTHIIWDIDLWDESPIPLVLQQYEDKGRTIYFKLKDKGVPFDLTDKIVEFVATKPDGNRVYNDCEITDVENGGVSTRITEQIVVAEGRMVAQLLIKNKMTPDAKPYLMTRPLDVIILNSVDWQNLESLPESTILHDQIAEGRELLTQMRDLLEQPINADTLSGQSLAQIQQQITNGDVARVAKAGDTMTGTLNMSNNKVTGLAAPTAGGHATNKTYVDAKISGLNLATYLPKSGGTMTGPLDMGGNRLKGLYAPVDAADAVRKTDLDALTARIDSIPVPTSQAWLPSLWGGTNCASNYTERQGYVKRLVGLCYISLLLTLPADGWGNIGNNAELVIKPGTSAHLPAAATGMGYRLTVGARNVAPNNQITAQINAGENFIRLYTYSAPLLKSNIQAGTVFAVTISGVYPIDN